jgi:hypothetical protein
LGSLWRHKDPQAPALKGTEKPPFFKQNKAYAFWLGSIKHYISVLAFEAKN